MEYKREKISKLIFDRLVSQKDELTKQFEDSSSAIGYFYIDDLLPEEIVRNIFNVFPNISDVTAKSDIREKKFVAYQMSNHHPLLEEVIYAFQAKEVVQLIGEICNLNKVYPDEYLYAGGLSIMNKGSFLNPHLDNSHDKDRNRWRVLNLLYYVTPDWSIENGGNLELWPNGLKEEQITIESSYNRLVVMTTHQNSWHSVSKVEAESERCCVSNYYFSDAPVLSSDTFHVTSFRGRPGEFFKDKILRLDSGLREILRSFFKKGIRENPHQYKKETRSKE
jgi:Rps23 Pro-64 3,4-dihydroxylase Tpa1-like proline 4-hydroxylase